MSVPSSHCKDPQVGRLRNAEKVEPKKFKSNSPQFTTRGSINES